MLYKNEKKKLEVKQMKNKGRCLGYLRRGIPGACLNEVWGG